MLAFFKDKQDRKLEEFIRFYNTRTDEYPFTSVEEIYIKLKDPSVQSSVMMLTFSITIPALEDQYTKLFRESDAAKKRLQKNDEALQDNMLYKQTQEYVKECERMQTTLREMRAFIDKKRKEEEEEWETDQPRPTRS